MGADWESKSDNNPASTPEAGGSNVLAAASNNAETGHTLFTSLRALLAKPNVLIVSWTATSEGLTFATITVLALPPMESYKQQAEDFDHTASAAGIVTSPFQLLDFALLLISLTLQATVVTPQNQQGFHMH